LPATRESFPLEMTQRRLLPLAVLFALGGAVAAPSIALKVVSTLFAVAGAAVAVWQQRTRPEVVVDGEGYAVLERGREKLRVGWSEVNKVRADASEKACYVDCGDPARNLLVPPRRGWGFRFQRSDELYARILDAVPGDKIELVPRLDPK
jgi:hypothetical protein